MKPEPNRLWLPRVKIKKGIISSFIALTGLSPLFRIGLNFPDLVIWERWEILLRFLDLKRNSDCLTGAEKLHPKEKIIKLLTIITKLFASGEEVLACRLKFPKRFLFWE